MPTEPLSVLSCKGSSHALPCKIVTVPVVTLVSPSAWSCWGTHMHNHTHTHTNIHYLFIFFKCKGELYTSRLKLSVSWYFSLKMLQGPFVFKQLNFSAQWCCISHKTISGQGHSCLLIDGGLWHFTTAALETEHFISLLRLESWQSPYSFIHCTDHSDRWRRVCVHGRGVQWTQNGKNWKCSLFCQKSLFLNELFCCEIEWFYVMLHLRLFSCRSPRSSGLWWRPWSEKLKAPKGFDC